MLRKGVFLLLTILIMWMFTSVHNPVPGRPVFGVCISAQANGKMYTYIAYIQTISGTHSKRFLGEDEFVKYASGYWPSVYNPQKEDLFTEEGLHCGVVFDSSVWQEYPLCSPMDSLWKIRFKGYPYRSSQEDGWANDDFRPSPKQAQYLFREFGIRNIDRDYFVDTNLWKLLKCVSNPKWIADYKALQ